MRVHIGVSEAGLGQMKVSHSEGVMVSRVEFGEAAENVLL